MKIYLKIRHLVIAFKIAGQSCDLIHSRLPFKQEVKNLILFTKQNYRQRLKWAKEFNH